MVRFGIPRRASDMQVNEPTNGVELAARANPHLASAVRRMDYGMGRLFNNLCNTERNSKTLAISLANPVLLFGPPIALLLFGLAAGWAFRGFKPDDDDSNGANPRT